MAEIRPFRAYVYSENEQKNLGDLISPPYDVIKPEQRQQMLKKNAHNSVALSLTDDLNDSDRYKKMAQRYSKWKADEVLVSISKPSFYLIEETYQIEERLDRRLGFIALLQVSPFEEGKVLPHEHTLSGPKKDRFELLQTMGAELSQILMCYEDPRLVLEKIYESKNSQKPFMECTDPQGIKRRLWLIENHQEIESLKDCLKDKTLLIADGHHRYETAVKYRTDAPSNLNEFVQVYFTNTQNPSFSILPIHRLFSLPEGLDEEEFKKKIKEIFQIRVLTKGTNLSEANRKKEENEIKMICSFQSTGEHWLLTRNKKTDTDAEIFSLQTDIFEKILGWDLSQISKGAIQYEHTQADYLKTLQQLQNGVGFFLPPTDLKLVMQVAKEGRRMPQKSTFFYPKLASGLLTYELGHY